MAHGLRGLVIVGVGLLVMGARDTRAWRATEYGLVGLTGSRKRAAILVLALVLGAVVAFDLYQIVR